MGQFRDLFVAPRASRHFGRVGVTIAEEYGIVFDPATIARSIFDQMCARRERERRVAERWGRRAHVALADLATWQHPGEAHVDPLWRTEQRFDPGQHLILEIEIEEATLAAFRRATDALPPELTHFDEEPSPAETWRCLVHVALTSPGDPANALLPQVHLCIDDEQGLPWRPLLAYLEQTNRCARMDVDSGLIIVGALPVSSS